MTSTFKQEVIQGQRFQFGDNWKHFLSVLNDERIAAAENSLQQMLEVDNLQGKTFLDIGSGSGLFSLAARRLGAKVHSFDYDSDSVACTQEIRSRYFSEDADWIVEEGSVLDIDYIKSLGQFDIVYSWGVLHHTGAMWQALENANLPVAERGNLFISIYNDQGVISDYWKKLKQFYNQSPKPIQLLLIFVGGLYCQSCFALLQLLKYRQTKKHRGMSGYHDIVDWIGGYPFEVAKPEEIFNFYRDRGYILKKLKTCGGRHGCNEFVFVKL